MKNIVIDMDGTLIDFVNGDIYKALESMSNAEYYRGLPIISDCRNQINELKKKGYTLRILSGIADYIASPNYISAEGYSRYFKNVALIKLREIERIFGYDHPFTTIDFTLQSESKAQYYIGKYGTDVFKDSILIDDYSRYCKEWRDLGSKAVEIGKDFETLEQVLNYILSREE